MVVLLQKFVFALGGAICDVFGIVSQFQSPLLFSHVPQSLQFKPFSFQSTQTMGKCYFWTLDTNFLTPRKTIPRVVLAVQKVSSDYGRAGRLRLMGKHKGHHLVAQPKLENTFWTDSIPLVNGMHLLIYLSRGFATVYVTFVKS